MWKCPTCGKEFVHQNENHTCEEIEKTIDAYISAQAEAVWPLLHQVRNTIRTALPEAQERISWRMPTYWSGHNIIHFAAFKKHIGVYPGEEAMVHFADRLTEFKTSKGAIQFPYDKPLPLPLIAEIATWCYKREISK